MGRRPIGTAIDFPPTPLWALRELCGKKKFLTEVTELRELFGKRESLTEVTELRELCVKFPYATEGTEKDQRQFFLTPKQSSIDHRQSAILSEVLRG